MVQNRPERSLSLERRLSWSRPPPRPLSLERDRLSLDRDRDLWRLWKWRGSDYHLQSTQVCLSVPECKANEYVCTSSSGVHRALASVHVRWASDAWSYRSHHECILCGERKLRAVRQRRKGQDRRITSEVEDGRPQTSFTSQLQHMSFGMLMWRLTCYILEILLTKETLEKKALGWIL